VGLAAGAVILGNLLVALTRTNIGRPVVDRTGLTGKFDWDIQWTADVLTVGNVTTIEAPSMFDAFREQAGLKLVLPVLPVPPVLPILPVVR
jgi:uncharacterized protein (TIGR03435 family)